MPWIIKDYESETLDLLSEDTFRDLEWPMGAQTSAQRDELKKKYKELQIYFEDTGMPPFHHGSHYNTMGFVLWYLIRMEPFTSLHVWLQDGKFDKADRLFDSVGKTYESCTTNPSDVKELIPEWFTSPEMFCNVNKLDLGSTQSGGNIDDVKLPKWASSPHDFVRKHREALESEYVSRNLHKWIDLIWGYKQRPPWWGSKSDKDLLQAVGANNEAVEACNVFFHLTYPGMVDLEKLKQTDDVLFEKVHLLSTENFET